MLTTNEKDSDLSIVDEYLSDGSPNHRSFTNFASKQPTGNTHLGGGPLQAAQLLRSTEPKRLESASKTKSNSCAHTHCPHARTVAHRIKPHCVPSCVPHLSLSHHRRSSGCAVVAILMPVPAPRELESEDAIGTEDLAAAVNEASLLVVTTSSEICALLLLLLPI